MAIEFGTTRIAAQTAAAAAQGNVPAEQNAKLGPVLGGESLTVTSGAMSDLEKLVARLKNENENTRQSVTQRRISILGTVLDSMADRISEAERKSQKDELTGLIGAVALIHPNKQVGEVSLKSLKKKYKTLNFAAGCSRDVIEKGADMLGWPLEQLLSDTLDAMKAYEAQHA